MENVHHDFMGAELSTEDAYNEGLELLVSVAIRHWCRE